MAWPVAEARNALVLLPLGSLEDHPGRVPAAFDTLLALVSSCIAAEEEGWLIAPPLGYGYSPCHRVWAGEPSPEALGERIYWIVSGLYRMGAAYVAVVDGHYGHWGVAEAASRRAGAGYHNVWPLLARAAGVDMLDWGRLRMLEEDVAEALASGKLPEPVLKAGRMLREAVAEEGARRGVRSP
jgi:creatinine amidohydrolase/Fe(II)-dependent formamide hydrolase-like protein